MKTLKIESLTDLLEEHKSYTINQKKFFDWINKFFLSSCKGISFSSNVNNWNEDRSVCWVINKERDRGLRIWFHKKSTRVHIDVLCKADSWRSELFHINRIKVEGYEHPKSSDGKLISLLLPKYSPLFNQLALGIIDDITIVFSKERTDLLVDFLNKND